MQGKLIVIAIGGNSLIEDPKKVTVDAQYRAAEKTGMSYTKAWKIIHDAESASGKVLVERSNGGRDGGCASLTDDARSLMALYKSFSRKLTEAKDSIIKEMGL